MSNSLREIIKETIASELNNPHSDLGAKIHRDCRDLFCTALDKRRLDSEDLSSIEGSYLLADILAAAGLLDRGR